MIINGPSGYMSKRNEDASRLQSLMSIIDSYTWLSRAFDHGEALHPWQKALPMYIIPGIYPTSIVDFVFGIVQQV